MKKRKGSMALCLLILFSMLLTLFTGLLFFLSHTAAEVYLYREGLRSVYAAESGANWGIGYLEEGNTESAAVTLTENGRAVKVNVKADGEGGTITSTASDGEGGNKRTLTLTYTLSAADGESAVTVTDVKTGV